MIGNPRVGRVVQVWYRESLRRAAPWHGRIGTVTMPAAPHRGLVGEVAVISRRPPRSRRGPLNHGVTIDGTLVVVPCGNLRTPPG